MGGEVRRVLALTGLPSAVQERETETEREEARRNAGFCSVQLEE